ncbi:AAA family ATPase [Falcatimonas sp. MSJ-15]|uniref:ATP-binding protein n=1 Tax=Falcatimonas sp. MSJ-15 TaxID=2841515 RepID=UPI001C103DEA|nr:AAA family ATPase [Falcatimonas sp. MSJ-15]MBU5469104.1 AAA family ATPase [Falcatimonas sp. MSJ-15]
MNKKKEIKQLKPPVEVRYKEELDILKATDTGKKPENWVLSPKAVRTFILGSEKPIEYEGNKYSISKKYYGNDQLVERCIITLAGNRGLMLVGEPGTAKTMLSELLSAAISGVSTNTIQGTAGTTEDMIKYSWNYALLLAEGPSKKALVPSPLYTGMEKGIITRFEEITRTPAEIQDSLISILSDKILNIPELLDDGVIFAKPGFNIIGTANTRDKGVNEMSSALKRRFNFETVMPVNRVSLEKSIIINEVKQLALESGMDMEVDENVAEILASTYHELREGISSMGHRIDRLENVVMSTAEAVSVYYQSMISGYYYGDGVITMDSLVQNLVGAVTKDSKDELGKIRDYFNTVIRDKSEKEGGLWSEYYKAAKWLR